MQDVRLWELNERDATIKLTFYANCLDSSARQLVEHAGKRLSFEICLMRLICCHRILVLDLTTIGDRSSSNEASTYFQA